MSKKKRKQQKTEFTVFPRQINTCRYTLDAWLKIFPQSSEEEWKNAMVPEHLLDYVAKVFQLSQQTGVSTDQIETVKIVTIDNNYFQWIQENKLEDTSTARTQYADNINSATATKLLKESGMDYTLESFAIPVLISDLIGTADATNFVMSPEVHSYLNDFLTSVYHTDVYVAPYYMTGDTLYDEYEKVANLAKQYFQNHVHVRLGEFDMQHYDESFNFGILYIPFFIKNTFDTALIKAGITLMNQEGVIDIKYMPTLATFCQSEKGEKKNAFTIPFRIPKKKEEIEEEKNITETTEKTKESFVYNKNFLFGYAVRSIFCGEIDRALIQKDFNTHEITGCDIPLSVYELGDYEASFMKHCIDEK